MEYQIVPMEEAHLSQIVALEQACFSSEAWSEAMFATALSRAHMMRNTAHLTAVDGAGTVLGYAMMAAALDEGTLESIAVAPDARRRGVADALLSAVTGFARERGLASLTLEVRSSNAPAIALYEKHGFVPVGRRKNYYSRPKEDAILMTLSF